MRYRQITNAPGAGMVERLTIVPLLPDGTLGALLPMDDDGAAAGVDAAPGSTVPEGGTRLSGDGTVLGPAGSTMPLVLIHGDVVDADQPLERDESLDAEESLNAAAARIAATQAGLEIAGVQVVAAEGLPEAQHLIVWAQAWPSAQVAEHGVAEHGARLEGLVPDELRRRVSADQGLIPGGASAAWIVADVAATIARRGRGTS